MEYSLKESSNSLQKIFPEEQIFAIKQLIDLTVNASINKFGTQIEEKLNSKINNKDFTIMFNQKGDVSQIEGLKKKINEISTEVAKLNQICIIENLNELIDKRCEEGISKNEIKLKYEELENKHSKFNNEFHQTINVS